MSQINFTNFSFYYPRISLPILSELNLSIEKSEKVLVLGPSGCGKSTLLQLIANLFDADQSHSEGEAKVAGKAALVMQDPESQIVMHSIGDDVAFSCENYQIPPKEIWTAVANSLNQVGISYPLDHDSYALSGGQKQRLALANALAVTPDILLLDEPTANLDPEGAAAIKETVLNTVKEKQQTLLVVEHNVELWADSVDKVLVLNDKGQMILFGTTTEIFNKKAELATLNIWYPDIELEVSKLVNIPSEKEVLSASNLCVGYRKPIIKYFNYQFKQGKCYALIGKNGIGKTALAMTLAGLQKPISGKLIPDYSSFSARELKNEVGVVFQNPEQQFVYDNVAQELAGADDKLIADLGLTELIEANPFTLSGGQKRRLSVAIALLNNPKVVIMDEPTFGQDPNAWFTLCKLFQQQLADSKTLIISTHDKLLCKALNAIEIEVQQWR
ncbi:MAG: ATP-binding cassette domain-containing protein [Micrococcaceae bacterium]